MILWTIKMSYVCFRFQITYALWPTSPYHDNFYDMYISNRTYESHFMSLKNKTLRNTSKDDRLSDNVLVSRNFLGIQLYTGQQRVMIYEARPQVSPSAFMSQLGGALNLWAGITVVVIVELLELGFRTLADLCKSKHASKSSSVEMAHADDNHPMTCITAGQTVFWGHGYLLTLLVFIFVWVCVCFVFWCHSSTEQDAQQVVWRHNMSSSTH